MLQEKRMWPRCVEGYIEKDKQLFSYIDEGLSTEIDSQSVSVTAFDAPSLPECEIIY